MLAQLVFVVGVDKTENKVPMSAICTLMVAPSCSPAPSIHTHTHTHTHTPFSSSLSLGWLLSSGSSAPLSLHGHVYVDADGGSGTLRGTGEGVCQEQGEKVHGCIHHSQLW